MASRRGRLGREACDASGGLFRAAGRLPRASRPRGFTLTEMLVVVLIIGMLAGMILGAVIAVRRKFARDNTRMMLVAIAGAVERYQSDWSDFPPGAGGSSGSEDLLAALVSTRYEGPYLKGDWPPGKDTDGNGRRELVDHWGRPIGYTHHRHYRGDPKADEYRLESDGPDLRPGTTDDIVNWKK